MIDEASDGLSFCLSDQVAHHEEWDASVGWRVRVGENEFAIDVNALELLSPLPLAQNDPDPNRTK